MTDSVAILCGGMKERALWEAVAGDCEILWLKLGVLKRSGKQRKPEMAVECAHPGYFFARETRRNALAPYFHHPRLRGRARPLIRAGTNEIVRIPFDEYLKLAFMYDSMTAEVLRGSSRATSGYVVFDRGSKVCFSESADLFEGELTVEDQQGPQVILEGPFGFRIKTLATKLELR